MDDYDDVSPDARKIEALIEALPGKNKSLRLQHLAKRLGSMKERFRGFSRGKSGASFYPCAL
jgi:hypothetical protein